MMKRVFHILLYFIAIVLTGCVEPIMPRIGQSVELTLFCVDPATKVEETPGVDNYRENLISWVDFFLYPGDLFTNPDADLTQEAKSHIRVESGKKGNDTFTLKVSYEVISKNELSVFAIVNYPESHSKLIEEGSSLNALYDRVATADFVTPANHKQDRFLMSGSKVLSITPEDRERDIVTTGRIELSRYASKITAYVHVANVVELSRGANTPKEHWEPMLDGMELYLENAVRTVKLGNDPDNTDHARDYYQYFSYSSPKKNAIKNPVRFATKEGQPIFPRVSNGVDSYYYLQTYPMYMYPQIWTEGSVNEDNYTCEPDLKLVVPWKQTETVNGQKVVVSQKQCYYKIVMPRELCRLRTNEGQIKRNFWYHFNIDVTILGAMTMDEAVEVPGTCFIYPWQNQQLEVRHTSVGSARYLKMERDTIVIRNTAELDFSYETSHPAVIKEIRVTRPYYGMEKKNTKIANISATVKEDEEGSIYPKQNPLPNTMPEKYLDYELVKDGSEEDKYNFKNQTGSITNDKGTLSINFIHRLNNHYDEATFDYSPYTIRIILKHSDEENFTDTVTIVQYPAIYIDRLTNSDSNQVGGSTVHTNNTSQPNQKSDYQGYTFVDGGAYVPIYDNDETAATGTITGAKWVDGVRQWRRDRGIVADQKPELFYSLRDKNEKSNSPTVPATNRRREYQWRTVSYTGGSMDMYRINVSVLENNDEFVIGDPRTLNPVDINERFKQKYQELSLNDEDKRKFYGVDDESTVDDGVMPDRSIGFAVADALYYGQEDDPGTGRTLKYYYPADDDLRTKNMLAPSFRISSKFSGIEFGGNNETAYYKVGDVTFEYALFRCATYQEDGFPAGRWRLPTMGEIQFIAYLSSNSVFSPLFGFTNYWSAHGAILVKKGSVEPSTSSTALLRCVYDSWYWGDDQTEYDEWRFETEGWSFSKEELYNGEHEEARKALRNKFVWGDRPR